LTDIESDESISSDSNENPKQPTNDQKSDKNTATNQENEDPVIDDIAQTQKAGDAKQAVENIESDNTNRDEKAQSSDEKEKPIEPR
jgi:hypothetical protein